MLKQSTPAVAETTLIREIRADLARFLARARQRGASYHTRTQFHAGAEACLEYYDRRGRLPLNRPGPMYKLEAAGWDWAAGKIVADQGTNAY